ncbi:L-arabinose transport system permease protein AraP [Arthrobacter sp. Bi83]|uniref:carbohydrate ABC transporter permease n=1 Tax=Arthrobacter sp. Bi83 TaxID=2822353 RepID=UPI001D6ACEC3|nr:sugar ABC transporter permease [Arthrobacter sp. Bi83]CAH0125391.1 L-arabinose transport system permease protein AraP [Arthrobacter sp. Bi83]
MTTMTSRGVSRGSRKRSRGDALAAAAFLAPFLILLVIFQFGPVAILIRDSFYSYSLANPDIAKFVGWGNFTRLFNDPIAMQSIGVTLLFAVGMVALVIPLAFLMAIYLNQNLPARGFLRTAVFLPVVTSSVVVATLWNFLLANQGLVNAIVQSLGFQPVSFLTDASTALPSIIIMSVWQQLGMATILYLGGLQSLPGDVMEASLLDGAGPVKRLLLVVVPLLSRTTVMVVVVTTVFALQSFTPAYVMTQGAPEGTTNLFVYQIYKSAFTLQQPGYASAMSIVLLLGAITVSLVQMRLLRTRWDY